MRSAEVSVLCIDDHNLVRDCVVAVLQQEPGVRVVGEARTVRGGIEEFIKQRPDVALVSLQTRGLDGLKAIRGIRRVDPAARIVVYATDQSEALYFALEAGAAAFVLKNAESSALLRAIMDASGRNGTRPEDTRHAVDARGARPTLTSREVEILELMTQGLRTSGIAATLQISDHTVKAHMKSLYAKLDVHGRAEALAHALRRGFVRLAADRTVSRVPHRAVSRRERRPHRPEGARPRMAPARLAGLRTSGGKLLRA